MTAPIPRNAQIVSGRRALLAVITLAVALTALITLQAVFSDRTGIAHRAPTHSYGGATPSAPR